MTGRLPAIPLLFALLAASFAVSASALSKQSVVGCNSLLAVDVQGWDSARLVTAVSVQGIVNRVGPRLYLVKSSGDLVAAKWAFSMLGCEFRLARLEPGELLERYRGLLRGVVVYDPSMPSTMYLALTIAGLRGAAVIHPDLLPAAKRLGLSVVEDLRGRFKSNIEANEAVLRLLSKTNQSAMAVVPPGAVTIGDYVVKHRMAIFSLSPLPEDADERRLLEEALGLHPGHLVFGFFPGGGRGEAFGVRLASRYGKTLIVADYASSLSFTEWLPEPRGVHHTTPPLHEVKLGSIYAAVVISDGDNIACLQDVVLTSRWWLSPARGSFPVTWTVNPWLPVLAPNILDYMASTATLNDSIVAGVSIAGHMDTTRAPKKSIEELAEIVEKTVREANLRALVSWDPLGPEAARVAGRLYPDGIVYVTFPGHGGYPGIYTHQGTLIVLGLAVGSPDDLARVEDVIERTTARPLFLVLYANIWGFKSLEELRARLVKPLMNKGVKLVTLDKLLALAKRFYALSARPWPLGDAGIELRLVSCRKGYVYSRVSGRLLAVLRLDPWLVFKNGQRVWASSLGCSIEANTTTLVRIRYSSGKLTVVKTYRVERSKLIVEAEISDTGGTLREVREVLLDELDTETWGFRPDTRGSDAIGPRYVYVPRKGLVKRRVGVDPFVLCRECSLVVVLDNATYPPGRAILAKLSKPATIVDAFSRGDADGDGLPEFHALLAAVTNGKDGLSYQYSLEFLGHGWSLRLPQAPLTDLLNCTIGLEGRSGCEALLASLMEPLYGLAWSCCTHTILERTKTVTKTMTKTFRTALTMWRTVVTTRLKLIETTRVKTVATTETVTRSVTSWMTSWRTVTRTTTTTLTLPASAGGEALVPLAVAVAAAGLVVLLCRRRG